MRLVPPHVDVRHGADVRTSAIRIFVPAIVAAVLGGYALALGLTGLPVIVAAAAGAAAGCVLMYALAQ